RDEAVLRLEHLVAGEAGARARVERLGEPRRRVVRGTDPAHLARAHQIVERAQGLLERRARVIAVRVVEVDALYAEPAQRGIAALVDLRGAEAGLDARAAQADLRGDHEVAEAALAQPRADDLFRLAAAVTR